MKKTILSLLILCMASYLLCACGEETPLLTVEDYKLDAENGSTSRGVKIGDNAEAFRAAYQDDMIFSSVTETASATGSSPEEDPDAETDSSADHETDQVSDTSAETAYQFLSMDEISFDTVQSIILPTFFIDGQPLDMELFCEENEIEQSHLLAFLTDESYLANHRVVYRYLIFTWEDGVITDIRSESMDYNQDGSYYEAN